jgi:hypothetical protein
MPCTRDGCEREAHGHEHLLDVPQVERADQHELDESGEDAADDEADEGREQEAQGDRADPAELRLDEPGPVRANREEGPVREVEDAHEAVDQ